MFHMLISFLFITTFWQTAIAQTNAPPTFKMDGKAVLTTNSLADGLTYTDKDPALQGQFWFNWGPQFRVGLWGSNTKFKNSETHFWLKALAELKIVFSENSEATLRYTNHSYFKEEGRNGTSLALLLNLFSYGVNIEQISNFLGTSERALSYSFTKTWDVFTDWKNENTLGYMTLSSSSYSNYFWLESWIGKKPGNIYYQVGLSYNTSASQFNGAGDLMFALKATVAF